jgi:hypothetical protein
VARLLCLIKVSVIIISSKIVFTVFISSDFIMQEHDIQHQGLVIDF